MGIRARVAAAFLALFLAGDLYAATRKTVTIPPRGDSIKNSSASYQTPNGYAAYYGQEFVDKHTAGSRFNTGDRPPGGGSTVSVKLKPQVIVPPAGVASKAKSLLKLNPTSIAASAAVGLMLEAVDAIIEDNQVKVPTLLEQPLPEGQNLWCGDGASSNTCAQSAEQYCQLNPHPAGLSVVFRHPTVIDCQYPRADGSLRTYYSGYRTQTLCPFPYVYDDTRGACVSKEYAPATEGDFSTMENVARGFDPVWLKDLITASCEGSGNPSGCYDELSSQGPLQGPTTQTPPAQATTTTVTNPDGTTSTSSTSTSYTYTYNYSPSSYTYNTTRTTTNTAPNGETTTEVETDTAPEAQEPVEDPQSEPEYNYVDTDFPAVEPFYVQKYPDGMLGAWNARKAEIDATPFFEFLQSFVPTFSGSCPSFQLNLNVMKHAMFGVQSFADLCYVFDFIKAIMMVTALFTARALIFGG